MSIFRNYDDGGVHNTYCSRRVAKIIVFIAFCLAQLLFTTKKRISYYPILQSSLSMTTTVDSSSLLQGMIHYSPFVRRRMQSVPDDGSINNKNTYWKNVEFNSGALANLSWAEHVHVVDVCSRLSGFSYMHHDYPHDNHHNGNCSGPLPTNTSCCHCYVSLDYEELVEAKHSYKYYRCAVPRNNSLLPLNATPRVDNRTTPRGAQVAWITGKFGHNNMHRQHMENFCQEVRVMNIMDPEHIHCYWKSPDFALNKREFQRHLRFYQDPKDASWRGGGYWFHKSVLLQHHLYHPPYQHGDLLVYTDADRIDFFRLGSFHGIVDTMMNQRPDDDLCIDIIGNTDEATYTKEDMLAAFNASRTLRASPQFIANIIVVRNSPTMKLFMDAWVECMSDWHMVSDEPSVLPNVPYFYENRHDQSTLGLLIKTYMTLQVVVGPPARPYHFLGQFVTYKFKDGGAEPTCPFSEYYFEQYKANAMLLRNALNNSNNNNNNTI